MGSLDVDSHFKNISFTAQNKFPLMISSANVTSAVSVLI